MASPAADPVSAARTAGLRYTDIARSGITRRRAGKGFSYRAPDGSVVTDPDELGRIRRLAIPPAWTDVWISPSPTDHLQATGRDARGRKQYRYHERWREVRDATKYARMVDFGAALPKIRARADADLRSSGLTRERVIAAVVRLLEATHIRIGNDEYARSNRSFGLTTLRDDHVAVSGSRVRFRFRGKSGVAHDVDISDARLARIVKRLDELPGQQLFQYLDENGEARPIGSDDVNEYLREASGQDFTAKDFRTWAGTVLAARELSRFDAHASEAEAKRDLVAAIDVVAGTLGNTRAICRKCYVHPAVVGAYFDGSLPRAMRHRVERSAGTHDLEPDEKRVLRLLHASLAKGSKRAA